MVASSTSRVSRAASGQLPVDDAADLVQLVHQVLPCCADARRCRRAPHRRSVALAADSGVKYHSRRVGALALLDDLHPAALRPDGRAARRRQRGRCRRRTAEPSCPADPADAPILPMVVVLPTPFTPMNSTTEGLCGQDSSSRHRLRCSISAEDLLHAVARPPSSVLHLRRSFVRPAQHRPPPSCVVSMPMSARISDSLPARHKTRQFSLEKPLKMPIFLILSKKSHRASAFVLAVAIYLAPFKERPPLT